MNDAKKIENLEKENTREGFEKAIENYQSSTGNYQQIIDDPKYGNYARKSIKRNKSLINRAELIIKKLKLEGG